MSPCSPTGPLSEGLPYCSLLVLVVHSTCSELGEKPQHLLCLASQVPLLVILLKDQVAGQGEGFYILRACRDPVSRSDNRQEIWSGQWKLLVFPSTFLATSVSFAIICKSLQVIHILTRPTSTLWWVGKQFHRCHGSTLTKEGCFSLF